jgi:hypothetical protein
MTINLNSLKALQAEWEGVVRMRERMQQLVISTFAFDPITSPAFGNILYNLPFLLAFDVLKHVLLHAREDGQFTGSGHRLADLMDSAKTSLPWIDWDRLSEGVQRRNEVAHNGKLCGDEQCLQNIADIEAQLLAWDVIAAPEASGVR